MEDGTSDAGLCDSMEKCESLDMVAQRDNTASARPSASAVAVDLLECIVDLSECPRRPAAAEDASGCITHGHNDVVAWQECEQVPKPAAH